MIENEMHRLIKENAITRTINNLFIGTDKREWQRVKACFADSVLFDMTSMAGGEPVTLTPQQIVDSWDEGLKDIEAIHHQSGNLLIDVRGDHAQAFCYGIAIHYRPNPSGINTRTFVCTYKFGLVNIGNNWKIDSFKFKLKFMDGNSELK